MNNHVELRAMIPRELWEAMQRELTKRGQKKPAFVRQAIERELRRQQEPPVFDSQEPL